MYKEKNEKYEKRNVFISLVHMGGVIKIPMAFLLVDFFYAF